LIGFYVSSWSKPQFGGGREPRIELVVEVAEPFVIVFVSSLVVGVGSVSPPSVQEEAEEERIDESGVKTMSVGIEDAVSLKGASCSP
jgi:hypothetical protein